MNNLNNHSFLLVFSRLYFSILECFVWDSCYKWKINQKRKYTCLAVIIYEQCFIIYVLFISHHYFNLLLSSYYLYNFFSIGSNFIFVVLDPKTFNFSMRCFALWAVCNYIAQIQKRDRKTNLLCFPYDTEKRIKSHYIR